MVLKIQFISDLHIEKDYPKNMNYKKYVQKKGNILILAGDICRTDPELIPYYIEFLNQVCSVWNSVYLIPGNHEYYSKRSVQISFSKRFQTLENIVNNIPNCILLNDKSININNDTRIYGSTFWSKIPVNGKRKNVTILNKNLEFVNINWMNEKHHNCLEKLHIAILQAKKDKVKNFIIATHYPPIMKNTLAKKFQNDPYRFYYASEYSNLVLNSGAKTWIFGHTHNNCDFIIKNSVRLVSNQYRGFRFSKRKCITLEE